MRQSELWRVWSRVMGRWGQEVKDAGDAVPSVRVHATAVSQCPREQVVQSLVREARIHASGCMRMLKCAAACVDGVRVSSLDEERNRD